MQEENYCEESVAMEESVYLKGKKKYLVLNILSYLSIVLVIISLFFLLITAFTLWIFAIPAVVFAAAFFVLRYRRERSIYDFDYVLVDGSMRIAKVLNGKNRKPVVVFDCKDIEKAGKLDSEDYHRYENMIEKPVVATPNLGLRDEKMYYIYFSGESGKGLVIFEPSSVLMLAIAKSAGKSIF